MINVLHVINGEHYSGAERVQDLLAQCLPHYGYNPLLACIKPDRFPKSCQCDPERVKMVPMSGRTDLRPAWSLARLARQSSAALLHTHTPRSALIGKIASRLTGLPMVHHVHSPTSSDTEHSLRNSLNAMAERFSMNGASRLITVSRSLARHLVGMGFSELSIRTVPNGVPSRPVLDRQPPAPPWTIGTVALFRPRKGLECLLHAVQRLVRRGRELRLLGVGRFETPAYERTILHLTHELGLRDHVEWTGFTEDVPAQLERMDCFVLPSLYGEGMPMVVLEAMATGIPVVATRVEGVPEVVRDGTDGFLVNPDSVPDLAEAMDSLLLDPVAWERMRRAARSRQRRFHSEHSMTGGVAGVYAEVMALGRQAS